MNQRETSRRPHPRLNSRLVPEGYAKKDDSGSAIANRIQEQGILREIRAEMRKAELDLRDLREYILYAILALPGGKDIKKIVFDLVDASGQDVETFSFLEETERVYC